MSEPDRLRVPGRRFFLESQIHQKGGPIPLPLSGSDLHHLSAVLRTAPGDELVVVEPEGGAWTVRVVSCTRESLTAEVLTAVARVAPFNVTLFQGMGTAGKTGLVVEKAAELNIEAFVPVITERSSVRLDARGRTLRGERLRRVALAAAKQARRGTVMEVSDPLALPEVASRCSGFDAALVVWEDAVASGPGIGQAIDEAGVARDGRVAIVVGPEGGLTSAEVYLLESAGARAVTLGETVLRTETAGIVAAALCVYELGGLGGRPRA